MNKNSITFGILGLLVGLAIGFFVANSINKNAIQTANKPQNPNLQETNPQMIPQTAEQKPRGGMQTDVQSTLDKAKSEPENYDAQIAAGKMHAQIKRFDLALEYFQNAQKLKPEDFAANALLGNAYFDTKEFEDAEVYYAKALEINPTEVSVRTDYATTFFKRSNPDYERAIKEFEIVLKTNPKHDVAYYNLAMAYLNMNEKEDAQKTLERLKEVNPESNLVQRLENAISRN